MIPMYYNHKPVMSLFYINLEVQQGARYLRALDPRIRSVCQCTRSHEQLDSRLPSNRNHHIALSQVLPSLNVLDSSLSQMQSYARVLRVSAPLICFPSHTPFEHANMFINKTQPHISSEKSLLKKHPRDHRLPTGPAPRRSRSQLRATHDLYPWVRP